MKTSFSNLVAATFGALFLAAMSVLFALWYLGLPAIGLVGASDQRLNEAIRNLEFKVDIQSTLIAAGLRERRGDVMIVAENKRLTEHLENKDPALQQELERVFSRLQRAYPDRYQRLVIVDPASGQIRASNEIAELGLPFQHSDLIQRASQPGITEMIEQLPGKDGFDIALVRQMTVLDSDGYPTSTPVGILIALINAKQFVSEGFGDESMVPGKHGNILLLDSAGQLLASSAIVGADTATFKPNRQVVEGFQGTLSDTDSSGTQLVVVYRHIQLGSSQGWTLAHYMAREEMLAGLKGSLGSLSMLGLTLTLMALWFIALLSRRLTRPLQVLSSTAARLGAGDLSARTLIALPKVSQEIATLAETFDTMAASMEKNRQTLEDRVQTRTAELQKSEARFRSLFESTADAILIRQDERYIDCNAAALKLFGATRREDLLNKHPSDLSPPTQANGEDTRLAVGRNSAQVLEQGSLRFEWLHRRLDNGNTFVADVLLSRQEVDGENLIQATVRDISEQKAAEQELASHREHLEELVFTRTEALSAALQQAEAANRAKSSFLSNMSHELRTPLNAVIGFSQLLTRSERLSAEERKNLDIINRSGNHLLTLINDVLQLSKIEAGQVEFQEESCDVGRLAQDVADMLRTRAEQAGLTLTLAMTGVPAALRTDTTKLRQILINLLGNAIKFTPAGSVSLTLKGFPAVGGAVRVSFEIRDTGIGIAPEQQQRIFEPFTQLVTHATSAGTGLGLSITRQYLKMLGSELAVESSPGQGACFRFALTLPLTDVLVTAAPGRREAEATSSHRILIVEDNADSRTLLVQLLAPLGLVLAEAVDGVEAVALAASFQPDLIIMDWRMPNLDGLAATRQIRAQTTGKPPKILMLSANAFEEQRQEALAAGIDDFLRKPLQENELYAALEAQLGCALPQLSHQPLLPPATELSPPATTDRRAADPGRRLKLTALPEALHAELKTAVEEMNPAKIKAVLAKIEPLDPPLAEGIRGMAEVFQYRELWELLAP